MRMETVCGDTFFKLITIREGERNCYRGVMETKELCNLQEMNRPYDNVNSGYHIPVNSHRNMLIPVIRGLLPEPEPSSSYRDYGD